VVELEHLRGGGEVEVVVVGGLIGLGVYSRGDADQEDDGGEDQEERDEAGGPGGFLDWRECGRCVGFAERDSQEDRGEKAEDGDGYQDRGGDQVQEIEAASEEDDDSEAAGGGECDGRATDVAETKEKGSVASDGEE